MPVRVPVVLSRDEVARIMKHLNGVMWMMVALLYGAGLRLQECLELRVKDIDRERRQIVRALNDALVGSGASLRNTGTARTRFSAPRPSRHCFFSRSHQRPSPKWQTVLP